MRRIASLLACALASYAGAARADVEIVPSSDGHLGAWLVSGPTRASNDDLAKPMKLGRDVTPAAALPAWRLVSARDGAIDLGKTLGMERTAGAKALLGGQIVLTGALDGWLLSSADGPIAIFIDGARVFERPVKRLRDGSWDAIRISLPKGRHSLQMVSEHPGQWWAIEVRLLDARDLLPPDGAVLALPATTEADRSRLLGDLASVSLTSGLGADGYRPRLAIEYRRGAPRGSTDVVIDVLGKKLRAGELPFGPRGATPFEVLLPRIVPSEIKSARLVVNAQIGKVSRSVEASISAEAPVLLSRAESVKIGERDRDTLQATLAWRKKSLTDAKSSGELADGSKELGTLLDDLDKKRDVLVAPGIVHVARRSVVDGEPDPLLIQVPAQADPKTRFPLVIALHGLNGSEQGILDAFLDSKRVDGFVIAPYAHGNAFYRGPGERQVLATLEWALRRYPIDPDRVSVTGVSMGGTGTAHLALYYADRFSAAAPLCGYQSYFVRRDTSNRPLRPWERDRMAHWSPTSIAERGQYLPMWVAHGTKDFPLENSRVLVNRYKELHYSMTDEWPDTGHNVWTKAYAGARLFPFLSRARRPSAPDHVIVKADQYRFAELYWVKVTRFASAGPMGLVDAKAKSDSRIEVETQGVDAFELARKPPIGQGAVEVLVDKKLVSFPKKEPILLQKKDNSWQSGRPDQNADKHARVEGPIRDAFLEPLVFVYGSLDETTRRANREVAEAFARSRNGPNVSYPVVADRDLDRKTEHENGLFIVGTPADHALLRELEDALPIRSDGKAIVFGGSRHQASGAGAIFIYPNPREPERYLVVITAPDPSGIWRALSLPQLLPDFLVYDDSLAPAASEQVLGKDAHVVAGGFFDRSWKLPADPRDPEAPKK